MDARLMDRLQKVMSLARSGVEGEAASAAAILQKMLLEHNLSVADLEKRGGVTAPAVKEQGHDLGKAAFKWKLDLAEAIAEYYYCHPLVNRQLKTVSFVGRPDNVESLTMLYGWVIDQIKRLASEERKKHHANTGEHIDPLRWQVSFGEGAVHRLEIRLEDERIKQQEEMSRNADGDVTALTLHHEHENSDYLEMKYGYRRDGKETARQRQYREQYEQTTKHNAEWLARDPEGYYKANPWDRPETAEQKQARLAQEEVDRLAERKRRLKNAARRDRYQPIGRRNHDTSPEEARRRDEVHVARGAGKEAADRINLRPFLTGQTPGKSGKLPE